MTILTLTSTGAVKLPKEIRRALGNPKHLQIRLSATGLTLSPVAVQRSYDRKAIPDASPNPPTNSTS